MTWEIVTGIIALCGFGVTIGTLVARVNKTLVRLTDAVEELRRFIERQERENSRTDERLDGHEKRIIVLEELDKGGRK